MNPNKGLLKEKGRKRDGRKKDGGEGNEEEGSPSFSLEAVELKRRTQQPPPRASPVIMTTAPLLWAEIKLQSSSLFKQKKGMKIYRNKNPRILPRFIKGTD